MFYEVPDNGSLFPGFSEITAIFRNYTGMGSESLNWSFTQPSISKFLIASAKLTRLASSFLQTFFQRGCNETILFRYHFGIAFPFQILHSEDDSSNLFGLICVLYATKKDPRFSRSYAQKVSVDPKV